MAQPCDACSGTTAQWPGPFETRFDLPYDWLVWDEGPLAGVAFCKACRQPFAFQCTHLEWNRRIIWRAFRVAKPARNRSVWDYADQAASTTEWLEVFDDQHQERCLARWVATADEPLHWHSEEDV